MKDDFEARLMQARQQFAGKNTMDMARGSGAAFTFYPPLSWREYYLPYLGRFYRILWPAGEVLTYNGNKETPAGTAIILLHYLINASGTPPAGKWLAFNQIWGGGNYNTSFVKQAQEPLADFFGRRAALFRQLLLEKLNSRPGKDTNTFLLMALPRIPLLLRLEPGTHEAPGRVAIMFDAAANEYLATEDLATLGESLAARLLRWGREQEAEKS